MPNQQADTDTPQCSCQVRGLVTTSNALSLSLLSAVVRLWQSAATKNRSPHIPFSLVRPPSSAHLHKCKYLVFYWCIIIIIQTIIESRCFRYDRSTVRPSLYKLLSSLYNFVDTVCAMHWSALLFNLQKTFATSLLRRIFHMSRLREEGV